MTWLPPIPAPPAPASDARLDVLLALPEPERCRIAGDILSRDGHGVRTAEDARAAFRQLLARLPDVAVISEDLPDLSGYEVLRALREAPGGEAPHAVLVAGDPLTARGKVGALDVARVFPRPLDVLDLADTLRDVRPRPAPSPAGAAPPPRTHGSLPPAAVPPSRRPIDDARAILRIPAGATPAEIERAAQKLLEHWEMVARADRSLDRRAQAAKTVARIRWARRQALSVWGR